MGRVSLLILLASVAAPLHCAPPLRAGDEDIPVRVKAAVDDKDTALTGRFALKLEFRPDEDVARAYAVQVVLSTGGRSLLTVNQQPAPPTRMWKKNGTIAYETSVPFPFDADL